MTAIVNRDKIQLYMRPEDKLAFTRLRKSLRMSQIDAGTRLMDWLMAQDEATRLCVLLGLPMGTITQEVAEKISSVVPEEWAVADIDGDQLVVRTSGDVQSEPRLDDGNRAQRTGRKKKRTGRS